MKFHRLLLLTAFVASVLLPLSCGSNDYRVRRDSVIVRISSPAEGGPSQIRLQVLGEKIIRVSATPDRAFHDRSSLVVLPQQSEVPFTVSESDGVVSVATSEITASVYAASGALSFRDASGRELLSSRDGGSISFVPAEVEGRQAYSTRVVFDSPEREAFYGLGQQQTGELDHKGLNEELYQYNTKISIPFVVSSRGYGLLFDAYSLSRWGNPAPYRQLGEVFRLYDADGKEGALTGTYRSRNGQTLVQREDSLYYENERVIANLPAMRLKGAVVTYEGEIEAPVAGDYY
ncbi:MAG: DUF4968 domain-containing protein, partial [Bacteroidales bacterium]|nr:DUF4968 domain-containing protein [Bacteroidales bacterium]